MPWYLDREHYAAIANLLLAGDVQAKAVTNPNGLHIVVVTLDDNSRVVWGNTTKTFGGTQVLGSNWSFTRIRDGGGVLDETPDPEVDPESVIGPPLEDEANLQAFKTTTPMDSPAEAVAKLIATFDYEATPVP